MYSWKSLPRKSVQLKFKWIPGILENNTDLKQEYYFEFLKFPKIPRNGSKHNNKIYYLALLEFLEMHITI